MALVDHVRRRLIDYGSPRALGAGIRERRWRLLLQCFPDLADMDVVDLGGTSSSWTMAPVTPAHVTLVNLDHQVVPSGSSIVAVQADACAVPEELRGRRFDLVFSNSLIEHVGGHARRAAMAATIGRLGDRHWIQTPYRYFPIEPHWMFPLYQFLPTPAQARIVERWHLSGWYPTERSQSVEWAMGIELLTKTELKHYFPESELLSERFAGLTKSLIALRRG